MSSKNQNSKTKRVRGKSKSAKTKSKTKGKTKKTVKYKVKSKSKTSKTKSKSRNKISKKIVTKSKSKKITKKVKSKSSKTKIKIKTKKSTKTRAKKVIKKQTKSRIKKKATTKTKSKNKTKPDKETASKTSKKMIKKAVKKANIKIKRTAGNSKVQKLKKQKDEDNTEIIERLKTIRASFSTLYARQLLVSVCGENAFAVLSSLSKSSTDEELAKRLKLKISDVRSTLNHLHNVNIINYKRTKDTETGWYTYRWYVRLDKMKEWINEHMKAAMEMGEDGKTFYCPKCGIEATYTFEEATENNFACPICNKMLAPLNKKIVTKIMDESPERLIRVIQRIKRL